MDWNCAKLQILSLDPKNVLKIDLIRADFS